MRIIRGVAWRKHYWVRKLGLNGFKGELSQGFCSDQVNSVLKSLLSTFTPTQNAPAELRSRYQTKLSGKANHKIFAIFSRLSSTIKFSSFNPFPSSPSVITDSSQYFQCSDIVFGTKLDHSVCGSPLMN